MKPAILLAALSMVWVSGCASPQTHLSEKDLAEIRTRFDEVARHGGAEDNEAWANDFTKDGIFMFNNAPAIHGREDIHAWGESGVKLTSLSFSDVEIRGGHGDLAWATSGYALTMEGVSTADRGKQLVVLKRQTDGTWLIQAIHVSSDLPRL